MSSAKTGLKKGPEGPPDGENVADDKWLHAWYDPLAGVRAFSPQLALADLNGDGEGRLVVADSDRRLKVFKGTQLVSDNPLLDSPVAVTSFFMDMGSSRGHKLPALAVASGPNIFIYRMLRPYYKFSLASPTTPVAPADSKASKDAAPTASGTQTDLSPDEVNVWQLLKDKATGWQEGERELLKLRAAGVRLTERSLDFLEAIASARKDAQSAPGGEKKKGGKRRAGDKAGDGGDAADEPGSAPGSRAGSPVSAADQLIAEEARTFIDQHKHVPLAHKTCITCMATLKKNMDDDDAVSCLVIGTEDCHVYILKPDAASIHTKIKVPAVPTSFAIIGKLDVEYRIVVATRSTVLYTIKGGTLMGFRIELDSLPVALAPIDVKTIAVATMTSTMHNFHVRGKRNFALHMPAPITNLEILAMKVTSNLRAVILALENRQVRVYNGRHLVSMFTTKNVITGMTFGQFGRQIETLVMTFRSGGVLVKMLPRKANLDASGVHAGPPPEQDVPLALPTATRLYVEQTQREKDKFLEMHRVFQRDLVKLRLATARSYLKVISQGASQSSSGMGSMQLRINASVSGLGPRFLVQVQLQNNGAEAVRGVPVILSGPAQLYKIATPSLVVDTLVPGLQYKRNVTVTCVNPAGGSDSIRIFVCNPGSAVPVITAHLQMPVCDPEME